LEGSHKKAIQLANGDNFKDKQGRLGLGLFHGDDMWPPEADRFGLDRYSNEHWIGSHPDLIPCDMSPKKADHNLWTSSKEPRLETADRLQWSPSPRHIFPIGEAINDDFWFTLHYQKELKQPIIKDDQARKREYFLLPGYLHKWIHLYRQLPSQQSWVWKWFPDGVFWKIQARRHGLSVLEKILNID